MDTSTMRDPFRPPAPSTRWEKRLVSAVDLPVNHPPAPSASTFARRHAWLGVLLVGTALFIAEERTLVSTGNPNLVPSAILLGASIVPLAFVAFVYGRRLPYRIPGAAVATAAFLGGVIGTIVAATLEFDAAHTLGGLPMLGVGLIEETSKLLVPLALLLVLRGYRSRADGLLVGVACGAGFAALETMGYAFTTLIQSNGNLADTVDVLLLRGFLSPAAHMAWTGIAAAALYAAAATRRRREILQFVGAFAGAVVLHALWDSQTSLIGTAVIAVLSLGLLTYTAYRAAPRRPSAGRRSNLLSPVDPSWPATRARSL
jgi:RsiW-degrading membrane proteinase PrsW (M82 family)